jgi:hypothetical protein
MLKNILFQPKNLQITEKAVPLHCVFHSIRFKVNKGWSKALLLFLYPYVWCHDFLPASYTQETFKILKTC